MQSEEGAARMAQRELKGEQTTLGPNVGACMKRADVVLPNHGTLDELRETVKRFFDERLAPDA